MERRVLESLNGGRPDWPWTVKTQRKKPQGEPEKAGRSAVRRVSPLSGDPIPRPLGHGTALAPRPLASRSPSSTLHASCLAGSPLPATSFSPCASPSVPARPPGPALLLSPRRYLARRDARSLSPRRRRSPWGFSQVASLCLFVFFLSLLRPQAPRPSPDRWDCGTHEATACGVVSPLAPLRDVAVPSGGRREVRRHVDSFALSGFALAAPILADEPETTGLATPSTSELPGEAVSVPQAAAGALSRVVRDAEGDRRGHGQNQRATETGGDHRLSPQAERVSPSPLHVEPQSNLLDFSSMPSSHEPAFTPQTEMRLRNRPMRKYLRRRLRHLPPPTHLISGAGQPSASAEHWVDVEDVTDKCLRYINWYRQEGLEHPLEPIKATTTLREDAAALVRRLTLTHCRGAYPFPSPRPLVPGAFDANWFGAKEPDCSFAALTWFSQFRHFDGQFPGAPVEELASGFRVGEFARMMHRRATGIGCARTRSCAGGVNWLVCLYGSVPHRPNNADLRAEDVIFGPEVWESILQREASAPGGTQAKEVLSASSEEADVSLHIRLSGTSEDALREGGGAIERPASASESSFSEAGRQFATQSSSMVGETFEGHDELWRVSWPGRMDLRPRGISGLAPRPRLAEVWGQDISEESVMDIARGGRRGVTIDEKGGIDKLFMTLTGRDGQDELLVVEVDEHSAERENEAELDIASSNQFQTAEQSDADEP